MRGANASRITRPPPAGAARGAAATTVTAAGGRTLEGRSSRLRASSEPDRSTLRSARSVPAPHARARSARAVDSCRGTSGQGLERQNGPRRRRRRRARSSRKVVVFLCSARSAPAMGSRAAMEPRGGSPDAPRPGPDFRPLFAARRRRAHRPDLARILTYIGVLTARTLSGRSRSSSSGRPTATSRRPKAPSRCFSTPRRAGSRTA